MAQTTTQIVNQPWHSSRAKWNFALAWLGLAWFGLVGWREYDGILSTRACAVLSWVGIMMNFGTHCISNAFIQLKYGLGVVEPLRLGNPGHGLLQSDKLPNARRCEPLPSRTGHLNQRQQFFGGFALGFGSLDKTISKF